MKKNRLLPLAGSFLAVSLALVLIAGCAGGPTKVGDATTLSQSDPAMAMAFSYQMAKPKPVPEDMRRLGDTTWEVTSMNPKPEKGYASMVLHFGPDGNLVETRKYPDGSVTKETCRYHIVGSTMIINKSGNDINSR